ncbi:hypothetical protein [Gemmobacter sp. 24YEA27]|uniref:hypothetical protein n=1 Tax=Gemmobacter sp. 24YEA27 TaxID=3040672 RepID=UPI0024B36D96|nr:hypothetical protein [Gemmobacter sp. 24YEA27]
MLPLESAHWAKLSDAYGSAADVPNLLHRLAVSPGPSEPKSEEIWEQLWSRLCHQDDVYDASYAALPHIVRIGCEVEGPIDFGFYLLPVSIELSRWRGSGPQMSADLSGAYSSAISRLMECAHMHKSDAWDEPTLRSALAAQAIAKGDPALATVLINLDPELKNRLIDLDFEI